MRRQKRQALHTNYFELNEFILSAAQLTILIIAWSEFEDTAIVTIERINAPGQNPNFDTHTYHHETLSLSSRKQLHSIYPISHRKHRNGNQERIENYQDYSIPQRTIRRYHQHILQIVWKNIWCHIRSQLLNSNLRYKPVLGAAPIKPLCNIMVSLIE